MSNEVSHRIVFIKEAAGFCVLRSRKRGPDGAPGRPAAGAARSGPATAVRGPLLAAAAISAALLAAAAVQPARAEGTAQKASTTAVRQLILAEKPLRGIHLSAWGSGSQKSRRALLDKISNSVINGVVVAVKEVDGKVFIPGVAAAHKYGAYAPAIANPEAMMRDFKAAGLYTAARVVVFKDK
ncbi:MAG: hypothetical protein FD189_2541, partial [Elusimicrobia bacterium]